jgi:Transposase and inactivated derivatives
MSVYSTEFKEEAIKRVKESKLPSATVAKELGISENTMRSWLKAEKKYKKEAFIGSGNLRQEEKRTKELERKIQDLEEENAILKKATAIFAKNQKP